MTTPNEITLKRRDPCPMCGQSIHAAENAEKWRECAEKLQIVVDKIRRADKAAAEFIKQEQPWYKAGAEVECLWAEMDQALESFSQLNTTQEK